MNESFYRKDKIRKFERTSTMNQIYQILIEKRKRCNKSMVKERL